MVQLPAPCTRVMLGIPPARPRQQPRQTWPAAVRAAPPQRHSSAILLRQGTPRRQDLPAQLAEVAALLQRIVESALRHVGER